MSYRNDLDAAVARGDALTHEVKRLTTENEELRAKKPTVAPRRSNVLRALAALSGLGLALVGGVVLGVGTGRGDAASRPAHEPAAVDAALAAATDLAGCADRIARLPVPEPRGKVHVDDLERTGAACRAQLRAAASALPADRGLTAWADAEDVLSNRISLMAEYYASDPAVFDGGRDGVQLWREYSGALKVREAALTAWRAHH